MRTCDLAHQNGRKHDSSVSTETHPLGNATSAANLGPALLVDTIPVFAPPAWIILAFIIIQLEVESMGHHCHPLPQTRRDTAR